MLTLLLASAMLQERVAIEQITLNDRNKMPISMIQRRSDRVEPPKLAPKTFGEDAEPWMFEWLTAGFVRPDPRLDQYALRFRVYSQERKQTNDRAISVARMLLRLWDLTAERIRIDHAEDYRRIVDVYLAFGGVPGGEQLFTLDRQGNPPRRANVIFIFALQSFTDPVEMAREVAHEYGHAILPAFGGYSAPEDWSNGYLGEKLYLMWVRDEMRRDFLEPADVMGATPEALDAWLAKNVDPLVAAAAANPPSAAALRQRDATAMDTINGLLLYMATILPDRVFGRSFRLAGSSNAEDYLTGIALAIEEPEEMTFRFPASWRGREVWVPVGKGTLTGATATQRRDGWAKVRVGPAPIVLTPPKR